MGHSVHRITKALLLSCPVPPLCLAGRVPDIKLQKPRPTSPAEMKYIPPCHVKLPQHSSLIHLTFIHSGEKRENANQVHKKFLFSTHYGAESRRRRWVNYLAQSFFLQHKGSLSICALYSINSPLQMTSAAFGVCNKGILDLSEPGTLNTFVFHPSMSEQSSVQTSAVLQDASVVCLFVNHFNQNTHTQTRTHWPRDRRKNHLAVFA